MENLTADFGIDYIGIKEFHIEERINEYAKGVLLVELTADNAGAAQEVIGKDTRVTVKFQENSRNHLLFGGTVSGIRISHDGAYCMELCLVSWLHKLDIEERSESYQDTAETYENILNRLIEKEDKAIIQIWEEKGKKTEKLFIQYEETDWQFVKRICSQMKVPLFEEMNGDAAILHIGIPKQSSREAESVCNIKIGRTYEATGSGLAGSEKLGFTSKNCYTLGDTLTISGRNYVICKKDTLYVGSEMIYTYEGRQPRDIKILPYQNRKITGAGIDGTILKRKGSRVKVQLDMDESQEEEKAWWFPVEIPYSAGNGVGWYLLAEEGERAQIYVPFENENGASVRAFYHSDAEENSKLSDPSVKYIGTGEETYAKFESGSINISGADGIHIELSDDAGITVTSSGKLDMHADKRLEIEGKTISIDAADTINLATRAGSMIIDDTTHLYAINGVWENGQPAKEEL